MTKILRIIPYYSQWESQELVKDIVVGKISAKKDPKWKQSGAKNLKEYELWSWNICGMACLKMILADKFEKEYKTIALAKDCEKYGGYKPNGSKVDGLFYDPFVKFLDKDFGIKARVMRRFLTIGKIKKEVQKGNYFIVSVHHSIREKEELTEKKGGHLVLITGFDDEKKSLFLHNPSGFYKKSQENFEISEKDFKRFFAGRGMLIE